VPPERDSSPDDRVYAGVGARETPPDVLRLIVAAATRLARRGWTMRTGMSPGADQAFYEGALAAHGRVELYLPWPAFESPARSESEKSDVFVLAEPTDAAYELSARFHPGWSALSSPARRLRARDAHQVLGRDLASPATLIACWTRDGSVDGSGPRAGGTGQALRIAHRHGVPVLNLARPEHMRELSALLQEPARGAWQLG
jgi:hypothetical protein